MTDYQVLSREITGFRRDLHRIPELGFFVYKTNAYITEHLKDLDCSLFTVAKTGILAFFDFGKDSTLCFRADMDGLPIEEQTSLPFSSTVEGCMHACGHDGHMAIMLGFARILDDYKRENKDLGYNALLLFQPAEETIEGAREILGEHIFDIYNIKAIFGLHLWPFLGKGDIASKPGAMMAKSTTVKVDIRGLSAHAGEPDKGRDALMAGCRFLDEVYDYVQSHIRERSVLRFGKMRSGEVLNAISDHTTIQGTMRTFEDKTWKKLNNALRHYAKQVSSKYGVTVDVDTSKYHPAVINDDELYARIKAPIRDRLSNYVELRRPSLIAEDFSFFEEEIPGVFFFLGTGTGIPLHSHDFNFEEDVLIEGVKLFDTIFTSY